MRTSARLAGEFAVGVFDGAGESAVPLAVEGESNLLLIVALILGLGVIAQVLADRFRVPSVLFLILAGVAVGPKGAGLVTQDSFGSALSTIVGLSVAIIVFEGAFHLKPRNSATPPLRRSDWSRSAP